MATSAHPAADDRIFFKEARSPAKAGAAAVRLASVQSCVSVVSVGEGTFWTVDPFGWLRAKRDFSGTSGFLAVATHIRNGLIGKLGVPPESILVEPNGMDLTMFRPVSRLKVRKRLGLDPNRFLIIFVGTFDHLKGGRELINAARGLDVGVIFLGAGPIAFDSKNMVFIGQVPHQEVQLWLSAADIFVLPTVEEGSCNAVIEAMACGLPIVTSNGRYMDDLVDDSVALRVDPHDVGQIRRALETLKDDPKRRQRMSEVCLEKAKRFDINERAKRVTTWMKELVGRRCK